MVKHSEYSVKLRNKETVVAAEYPEKHVIQLSNLDLLLPAAYVGVFLCYKKPAPEGPFTAVVGELKASLARTLALYYPFTGEVVLNSNGEPELHCNNHGVDFLEAYIHVELQDLDLHDLGVSVEKKLLPSKHSGTLCVQVTELKCGGVVIACAFDHRIADAYSTNMFLQTWAEISTTKPISHRPIVDKSTLSSPRSPAHHDLTIFDSLFVNLSCLPPSPPPPAAAAVATRLYYLRREDIHQIKAEASSHMYTPSKLESFCAFLWRSIKESKLGVVVDGRRRLSFLPDNYFGNVLSLPFGELESEEEISRMKLSEIAEVVGNIVRSAANEEHFVGLIEWVEKQRPAAAVVAKAYVEKSPMVSSGLRFAMTELNFGWGSPAIGSYHLPSGGGESTYVMPMPSPRREGDWLVYVCMKEELLVAVEAAAGDVLRPITPEYLGLR